MKFKALVALILIISFVVSGQSSSFALVSYETDVIFKEDFNAYNVGDKTFNNSGLIVNSNGGFAQISEIPDLLNKSLCIQTNKSNDTVTIEKGLTNENAYPLNISFRIYTEKSQSFSLPTIHCYNSAVNLIDVNKGVLTSEGTNYTLSNNKWHYVEALLSSSQNKVDILIDGKKVLNLTFDFANINKISFNLSGESKKIYIDDIAITKSTQGSKTRSYYNSELYLDDNAYHNSNEILQSSVIMFVGKTYASLCGKKMNLPAAPFVSDEKIYVPLRIVSEALGAEVTWQPANESAILNLAGEKIVYTKDKNAILKGNNLFVPADEVAQNLGRELYNEYGFIYIGSDIKRYMEANDAVKQEVQNTAKYSRPTGDRIISDLIKRHSGKSHPRLLATSEDFQKTKALIKSDEMAAGMYAYIKNKADDILATSAAEYTIKENIRLGDAATLMPDRLYTLSLIWRLSDKTDSDKVYAKRAWEELQALINFKDWNEQHFLDTASLLTAAAIGYDWLYDYTTDSQKQMLRNAIVEKGLNKGYDYMTGKYTSPVAMSGWYTSAYNWNPYCNSALIMASLAIGDESDVDVGKILDCCMKSIEYNINEYSPDGGWEEGAEYWNETVFSLVRIISSLESATGTDYGYLNVDGIKETCYYYIYILGPDGIFNYSDANQTNNLEIASQFWMAKRLSDPNIGRYRKNFIKSKNYKCKPVELLWYDPDFCSDSVVDLSTDKYFQKIETTTMRSSWDDDAFFAGFHSGRLINHCHYDTGSFVLDWGGKRWVYDLGTDRATYTSIGMNEAYRGRAEGHNTLVFDSSPYDTYNPDGDGYLELFNMNPDNIPPNALPDIDITQSGSGKVQLAEDGVSGNKCLSLSCTIEGDGNQAFIQKKILSPHITKGAKINFKIKLSDSLYDISMPEIQSNPSYGNASNFSLLKFAKDKSIYYHGADKDVYICEYRPGKWVNISIDINMEKQNFTLYVDDWKYIENEPLPKELSNISFIRFPLYRRATTYYIDDFSIMVHHDNKNIISSTVNLEQQNPNAYCKIDRFESSPKSAFAISDISSAYYNWVESSVRGVMLSHNKEVFTVRDEVKLKRKTDVYWFAHISADTKVTIGTDTKSALLEKNGMKMWVGIISDIDASIDLVEAKPLSTSPNPAGQADNSAYKKLQIKICEDKPFDLSVSFIPLKSGDTAPDKALLEDKTFTDWN